MTAQPFRAACPHCKGPMIGRSRRTVTRLYSVIYYRCQDDECGASYAASLEITHMISPSACPDPSCTLPYRPALRRPKDVQPPPANDDGAREGRNG